MNPPKNAKQIRTFLGLVGCYQKFIKIFACIAKPLTARTHHVAKFALTPSHLTAFNTLKSTLLEAPTSSLPRPFQGLHSVHRCLRWCLWSSVVTRIWWPRTSSCIFFHTFTDTEWKRITTEQEACGIYYAMTKWNYYLQGSDIIVHNDQRPLQKFLNGKNANNKVNRWSLEPATYNITFEWISGSHNQAAYCLSWMVDIKDTSATPTALNKHVSYIYPKWSCHPTPTAKYATLPIPHCLQLQQLMMRWMHLHLFKKIKRTLLGSCRKMDPFCTHISKRLLSGRAPLHEVDTFTHIKGLIYKHVMDSNQRCLALVIPW